MRQSTELFAEFPTRRSRPRSTGNLGYQGDDSRYCFRMVQMLGSTVDLCMRQYTEAVWTNFTLFPS